MCVCVCVCVLKSTRKTLRQDSVCDVCVCVCVLRKGHKKVCVCACLGKGMGRRVCMRVLRKGHGKLSVCVKQRIKRLCVCVCWGFHCSRGWRSQAMRGTTGGGEANVLGS